MTVERLRLDVQPQSLPPHNTEAEEAILGSALLDKQIAGRVRAIVEPRDFYREGNGAIYRAMLALNDRDEPVDYLTLIDELERTGELAGVGGTTRVAGLLGAVPTPIHAETYARMVADAAVMRRLISAGGEIARLAFQNQLSPSAALARSEQLLANVPSAYLARSGLRSQVEVLGDVMERLRALADPARTSMLQAGIIPSTFRDLDALLNGGFQRGDLVVVGGRPGMGKSSLMLSMISGSARLFKLRSLIFSLEMSDVALSQRQLSDDSGIPLARFRDASFTEAQQPKLGASFGQLADFDIMWAQDATQTVASIRATARRVALGGDLDVVVVDHVQLMDGPGGTENRVAQVSAISRGLKGLASDLGVVVIALSQLNRAVEQRADKLPQMSDLRDSGALEQDADVVLLLSREEEYKPDTERKGVADLQVAKARSGRTGQLVLAWNGETTGFKGMEYYDVRS